MSHSKSALFYFIFWDLNLSPLHHKAPCGTSSYTYNSQYVYISYFTGTVIQMLKHKKESHFHSAVDGHREDVTVL